MEADENSRKINDDLTISVLLAALTRPADEQEGFVHEACSGDHTLRDEVQRRLHWESRMNGFLLTPALTRELMDRPFALGETVQRRFHILRIAGEGGMGVVYEAMDEKLGHRIALKCPRYEFRSRLSPEAMNSLLVTHPNVCRVYEIHTVETRSGDVDFLTMEFLDGETLSDAMAKAPVQWLQSAAGREIAKQICAGLSAVHAQSVVHRDLKPGNVMLSRDGVSVVRAVIMDFGIAQGGGACLSQMRGTPSYVAPELWKGQMATVQSDIYALGVLLYEMACGRKPFVEKCSWKQRLGDLPVPPEGVAEPMRSAILRCLHPEPSKRFASMAELERVLWGGSLRRQWIGGVLIVGAAAMVWSVGRESVWPTSPVRLVILSSGIPNLALVDGFVSDIEYRLKTLRGARRPLAVFASAEIAKEHVKGAEAAFRFGATHVLVIEVGQVNGSWSITAELAQNGDWGFRTPPRSTAVGTDLAGMLFAFQEDAIRMTNDGLSLRAAPKAILLPASAYEDYLRGLHFTRVDYEHAEQAIPFFDKVIAAAPNVSAGYAGLAEALLWARRKVKDKSFDGKAVAALARAEQLEPDSAHVRLMAGRLSAYGGYFERALVDIQRAAELNPHDPEVFIAMGYVLYLLKRPQEAEAAFRTAVNAQLGYYKPWLDMGLYYYEQRKFSEAERYWKEAVRLAPGQTRSRLNLAALYMNQGRLVEAEVLAQECLQLRKTPDAVELLGDLQAASQRHAEAAISFEAALQMEPTAYKTWASLARTYRILRREKEAIAAYRRGMEETELGLRDNPREVERVAWCAFYHAALGEELQSRGRASEALGMGSAQGNVKRRLALTFGLLNDVDAALSVLKGAPPDLIMDLDHSPDLASGLRLDPNYQQLTR